jgi:Na+/H+ antiporter NhaA
VLLGATVAALVWANSPWPDSYESVWTTKLSIQLGSEGISLDLRHWVNQGLMTFFFLVIGLEAKRELDVGGMRERRRITIPLIAAFGGMALPIAIYLAFNAGGSGADGWGAAMSTTPPSHSACSRWWPAEQRACGSACSRSWSSTTSWRCW